MASFSLLQTRADVIPVTIKLRFDAGVGFLHTFSIERGKKRRGLIKPAALCNLIPHSELIPARKSENYSSPEAAHAFYCACMCV